MSAPVSWGLAVAVAFCLLAARADVLTGNGSDQRYVGDGIGGGAGPGCVFAGRWHAEGGAVATGAACLRCACARGALQCRRRACAPLPDPLPRRCHSVHKKNACCPELHCPEGVSILEHGATGRFENDDFTEIAASSTINGCVEGGAVYAAGSAMGSRVSCEQCFCLGGARRCVRPRCLPPPPACRPRRATGACCPTRYYCNHSSSSPSTSPPGQRITHDCFVDGRWVTEGEPVARANGEAACTQCFCLRGAVHCHPLACAPALMGCRPLLKPGSCCPHQYQCPHESNGSTELTKNSVTPNLLYYVTDNGIISTLNEDRSFHTSKSSKLETSTKTPSTVNGVTTKRQATSLDSNKEHLTTNKVKRKTNEQSSEITSHKFKDVDSTHTATTLQKFKIKLPTTEKIFLSTTIEDKTAEITTPEEVSDKPEGTVKILINGTINCTAELSSTSEALNITNNETNAQYIDSHARNPIVNIDRMDFDDRTFNPNDIITDSSINGGFYDNDMFTINVTSSLRTNTSHSTPAPGSAAGAGAGEGAGLYNKTKEDYDYDYNEPTLPPSLPNLKIIPFVAADAVVEEKLTPKVEPPYPIMDREDKFPVYYPNTNTKETPFAIRREDVYDPIQYPVFTADNTNPTKFPALIDGAELSKRPYTSANSDLATLLNEYTIASAIASEPHEYTDRATKPPVTSTKLNQQAPLVNLFSPPIETEGGFIPKGPGIMGEYYAVYPSTPVPSIPHLTTSMQLDTHKDDCISSDGRRIPEGDSLAVACSVCACRRGAVRCAPRACRAPPAPPGCRRRAPTSSIDDLCCGDLVCEQDNITTMTARIESTTEKINSNIINDTEIKKENKKPEILQTDIKSTLNYTSTIKNGEDNQQKENVVTDKPIDYVIHAHDKVSLSATVNDHKLNVTAPIELPFEKNASVVTTQDNVTEMKNETETIPNDSQEYEDEEEDEGFSFGSVLKLLLSDSYDTTTAQSIRKKTTFTEKTESSPKYAMTTTKTTTTTNKPLTTVTLKHKNIISKTTESVKRSTIKPSIVPFVPLPNIYPPSKKILSKNTNRIDHLVLGETTSIKKITSTPPTTSLRPFSIATRRPFTPTTTRPPEVEDRFEDNFVGSNKYTSVAHAISQRPGPAPAAVGAELLKLAGCNIYGKMYKVGKVITELSTPCLECRCTELGVQCRALNC